MTALLDRLTSHDFRELFIDELGWDHAGGEIQVEAENQLFSLVAIAQKRGFHILHCLADRHTLSNRRRLRSIQQKVSAFAHEHIVIYSQDAPRKQVWQWSIRKADGRRFRHREHPFFSHTPPAPFLNRLDHLRFRLEEEDRIDLVEALARVRRVLDTEAELKLFVSKPWYAAQSDRLFQAMRAGGEAERHAFLLFHRPMIDWSAKKFHRRYHHEEDDAQQLCAIGLMHAARLYNPDRGFQFSTYAINCMMRTLERYRGERLLVRLPVHVWAESFRIRHELESILVTQGVAGTRERLAELEDREPGVFAQYKGFEKAHQMERLDDQFRGPYRELRRVRDTYRVPLEQLVDLEWAAKMWSSLTKLIDADAKAIFLKFGFDGRERTLEQVGKRMRITRERVRQRVKRGIERLREILRDELLAYFDREPPRAEEAE